VHIEKSLTFVLATSGLRASKQSMPSTPAAPL
jgi:hypothetical protein